MIIGKNCILCKFENYSQVIYAITVVMLVHQIAKIQYRHFKSDKQFTMIERCIICV